MATELTQAPMFPPKSDWKPPKLDDLPDWRLAKRVGVDTETYDPFLKQLGPSVRRGGEIVGYSFALEDGPDFYVPLRHPEDNVSNPDAALRYLGDQAKAFKGTLVGANLSYDLDYLAEEGIEFNGVEFLRDVLVADPLISELHNSYSLQAVATRHGLGGKDESLLVEAARAYGVDPKAGIYKLPARFVGPYAGKDASLPLAVLRRQERIIDEQELWNPFNLESRVLPALLRMRRRGIRVDQERLEAIERWSLEQETECLREVHRLTGIHIDVGDVAGSNAVAPALKKAGMELARTPTGKISVKKEHLEAFDNPVGKAILQARKVNKLRTTFAASIRRHMVNGRIHCNFNQLPRQREDGTLGGARYGRMSSSNPNMQQQPSRDEFAKRWRSIYRPDPGEKLAAPDYSQQEPRMLTHYAVLAGCEGAKEVARRYHEDPNLDNHQMMSDLTGLKRRDAKDVYLGLCYGMGSGKLASTLGLPTETRKHSQSGRDYLSGGPETMAILEKFNAGVPFLRELSQMCERVARRRGYILLFDGRRCRFPEGRNGYDWTHKGLNRLIQGSSAVQTKIAIVYADAAGIKLQLQVHDELVCSITDMKEARMVRDIMRDCVPLEVPSKIDVEIGPSWGEAVVTEV